MRLAISNIAWDVAEDTEVAKLIKIFNIDAIDVAPGKYFPEPLCAKDREIKNIKNWWADQGIELTGMQSLLFGTSGFNVFGDAQSKKAMLAHLDAVCRIGAGLGATRVVFGSPKNRDRSGLSDSQALEQAVDFFYRLGVLAKQQGVVVCLEPNPSCYGSNFMTTTAETANVVSATNHPAIRLQFDTGALTINHESASEVLAQHSSLIGHIHASEPNLVPLGEGGADHFLMCKALKQYLPQHVVSVEMVATKVEPHLVSVGRALQHAVLAYQAKRGAD